MAIVNQNFRNALANISKNVYNMNGNGRIYIYSNAIAKPTNIQTTAFTLAPYSSALLLTFIVGSNTFLTTNGTVLLNVPPASATATGTGTASWAAVCHEATPTTSTSVIIGDVTLQTGDGMIYLPTLGIVSGTIYSILECSWTFS